MWTNENRGRYDRSKLRYPSDLTDDEWALIAALIPPPKSGGGKRTRDMRDVVNGLMYVLNTECQCRAIPKDLLPRSTVHGYFDLWDYNGTLTRIHPFLLKLYADGGYQGPVFQTGLRRVCQSIEVESVKRSDVAKGFKLLPKRWLVERTIAWLNRCRRLAKDWECQTRKALAFLHLASIRLMMRKLYQITT